MWPSIIVGAVVVLILGLSIYWQIRRKRSGKSACGCDCGCSACHGDCAPQVQKTPKKDDSTEDKQ